MGTLVKRRDASASAVCSDDTATGLRGVISRHTRHELYDNSGTPPGSIAIYYLYDPRDLRSVCYVGQTNSPGRRFRQHLTTARLAQPDELPWWIKSDRLRPLYIWIRDLYRRSGLLPTMVIEHWVESRAEAMAAERTAIYACLKRQPVLFNAEIETLGPQIPLL